MLSNFVALVITWAVRRPKLAGMDENRTHPGRLNSAPQTVLKTVFLSSNNVGRHSPSMEIVLQESSDVRRCPLAFTRLAVILAVTNAGNSLIPTLGSTP